MDEIRDVDYAKPRFISCQICQNEIPLSEAVVPEASDYAAYFCSRDCYASWLAQAAESYPIPPYLTAGENEPASRHS